MIDTSILSVDHPNLNLFESFFIFGVEKKDIIEVNNLNKTQHDLLN